VLIGVLQIKRSAIPHLNEEEFFITYEFCDLIEDEYKEKSDDRRSI